MVVGNQLYGALLQPTGVWMSVHLSITHVLLNTNEEMARGYMLLKTNEEMGEAGLAVC